MKREIDEPSGQKTTGHEWDGLKELDTPVPRAFNIWLALSIAVCVVLWVLYPAWPSIRDYSKGTAGYSSRERVTEAVAVGLDQRLSQMPEFSQLGVAELASDPTLEARYGDAISVLYRDNCAACHGRDLSGQANFPDLTDDHWLWSGTPEEIEYTLQVGINHTSLDTRWAQMPAFGDGVLARDDISAVVAYVQSISGQDHDADLAAAGALVFEQNCMSCHGAAGIGGEENGAPNLTDSAWIYGSDRDTLVETIKYGRQGVMPGWAGRLSDEEIRMLTLYVIWAGQDGDQADDQN